MNTLSSIIQLENWFKKPLGKSLLEAENNLLGNLLPKLFGYHLLQMGGLSENLWLKHCRIPHRIHLSPGCPCHFDGSCIVGKFDNLPLACNSIDVALLPHVLEFADRPELILQETYNALAPEGHIVILGFHPWSLWGLAKLFKNHHLAPWSGKFYSSFTVRYWLREAGYTVENHQTLFFRPPLTNPYWLKKIFFMEAIGQLLWPYLGGIYLIVAKKKVLTFTPARMMLKTKKIQVSGMAQPTVRMDGEYHN